MKEPKNPFIVTGRIPADYFCDREQETNKLVHSITNDNNMVLVSPRRMGKTGLLFHTFDCLEVSQNYYTFFIDILHTTSLREFSYLLGRHIYETLLPRSKRMIASFLSAVQSLSTKFGIDPIQGTPTFSLELGDIVHPELTLEEIFNYLEHADMPCVVAIDEFQQIAKYPEKNVEALLRTHIQRMSNVHFIFAGSEFHVIQKMFASTSRPFYNSADMMELQAIDKEVYTQFVVSLFESRGRSIDPVLVGVVYDAMSGNTYAMQKIMNEAYSHIDEGESCDLQTLNEAAIEVVESKKPLFREMLSNVPERHKPLLAAIAADVHVTQPTSLKFMRSHKLTTASAVQNSLRYLIDNGFVMRLRGVYSIVDEFFRMWVDSVYGSGMGLLKN